MSMIGKTLGNFALEALLGKGGMGEVYRAKDQKLGRDVAIKVLPEEFAKDTDRVARFQREAKLLASLNHPNIAAIHGLEEANGTHFLVLELIEGDTLADRIKSGPIPVEESLKLTLQIAEALEAAHEKGVIHRDLKPANIKVTPDGKVKVLDFGLAKAFAGGQAEVNLSQSPTLSEAATLQGVILGTAAYMSPEQARGKPVDKRTDIWAFGCVLYEMLTGKAAFQGEDVTEILAAVVKSGVNLDLLPANIHPRVREAIIRCLQKDQKKRYGGIGEAQYEIERVLADPSGVFVSAVPTAKPRKVPSLKLPWVAAAIILGIIVAGVAVWYLRPPEPRQVMRFDYDLPAGQEFGSLSYPALAISSDGKQIVYSTAKGLFLRSINESSAKLIPGTEGITAQPCFSPDGQWICYFSYPDPKLKKININGGAPVALCDASATGVTGIDWSVDDTIIYGMVPGEIMRVSANGGTPEPIFKVKTAIGAFPQMLPDGKSVLYTGAKGIQVQSLSSGESKELFEGIYARYLPTGHIVYTLPNSNSIFAVPFDLERLDVKGEQVPIVEGVINGWHFAVSDSGTIVYIPGPKSTIAADQRTLVWVDRKGEEVPITAQPNSYFNPHLSPDGTKVALDIAVGNKSDIWIWDLILETMSRLTFDEASFCPLWTRDGKYVAYASEREDKISIYQKAADGAGGEEKLGSVSDQAYMLPWSWSADEKTLLTIEGNDSENRNIGAISMEGERKWRALLNENYYEAVPNISPDGRWMVYCSGEFGQIEIFVRPFPELDSGKWQVSGGGGECPLWAPDGRTLFYQIGDSVMAVPVETEPTFKAGKPTILFQGTYAHWSQSEGHPWDIHPDGKRFLMMKPVAASDGEDTAGIPRKINIVVNWFEELKERVPMK